MFREDFWEEEERLIREEEERVRREGKRKSGVQSQTAENRPGSQRVKTSGTGKKKKKVGSISGSVSSVRTASTGSGSVKKSGKKKKRTAEQAVAGL